MIQEFADRAIMKYIHLTDEERHKLAALRKLGYPLAQIAREMSRSPSSVGREIKRNAYPTDGSYKVYHACRMARGRRQRCRYGITYFSDDQWACVEALIREDLSPEQIAGVLGLQGRFSISHESIYRYIWKDKRLGGDLYTHLRGASKQRRKRHGSNDSRGRLRGKSPIEERPAVVEERSRIGDWEIDTVFGSGKEAILTLVERKSGFVQIGLLKDRTVIETNARMCKLITRFPKRFLTITSDNGTEFNGYKEIESSKGIPFYFAQPYHSWERGTNENTNGLIRQYLPKGSSFKDLTQSQCNAIASKLNNRPRKRHGYATPENVFHNHKTVALRA